jgi:hypothetical protein
MTLLTLPGKFRSQPLGRVQIDQRNHFARDLAIAWLPRSPILVDATSGQPNLRHNLYWNIGNYPWKTNPPDLVSTNTAGNLDDYTSKSRTSRWGMLTGVENPSDSWIFFGNSAGTSYFDDTNDFSWYCIMEPLAGFVDCAVVAWTGGVSGQGPSTWMDQQSGTDLRYGIYDGDQAAYSATGSLNTVRPYGFGATIDYSATTCTGYIDGVMPTDGSGGVPTAGNLSINTFANSVQDGPLYIGTQLEAAKEANHAFYAFYLWSRTLTDSEMAEIDRNPWQIFKPATARVYSFPSAAVSTPGVQIFITK